MSQTPSLYIGLMSGTSLDGVDIVLCRISTDQCELLHSHAYTFDQTLKNDVLHAISHPISLYTFGTLDQRLAILFSTCITTFLNDYAIDVDTIEAIGSHGQTLWHSPSSLYPFSMQLGDASTISAITQCKVVANFRQKDVALCGQGAPFAPAFHEAMFTHLSGSTAVINIGGMANVTFLQHPLLGYDTGPGNVLMDLYIQEQKNCAYDKDGAWAKEGQYDQVLLNAFLADPYFKRPAPKSTGREYFNKAWLTQHVKNTQLSPVTIAATLLELTVRSIVDELNAFSPTRVLICGGGAKNTTLMQRLQTSLHLCEVTTTDEYGVDSEFLEAMAFAWLAYKRIKHEPVNLKDVTGATKNTLLGGVYE